MKPIDFDTTQTRGVLAGAYRGKGLRELERGENPVLLTHLLYLKNGEEVGVGCRQPLENLADAFCDPAGNSARPTCKVCGRKWDRIQGAKP